MAIAASASEKNPAEHGNIVIGLDGPFAARTPGRRRNDRNVFRNAGNANIQEAADNDAKKEKEEWDHRLDCATGGEAPQRGESDACRMANGKRWLTTGGRTRRFGGSSGVR